MLLLFLIVLAPFLPYFFGKFLDKVLNLSPKVAFSNFSQLCDDEANLFGINVKAYFFDSVLAESKQSISRRLLPFIKNIDPKLMFTEGDHKNFKFEGLIGQPDTVFEYDQCLISVEYKSKQSKDTSEVNWHKEVRLVDMLQCIAAGYVASKTLGKDTFCVLRYHNVCFGLQPSQEVLDEIIKMIPLAQQYHGDSFVSATQIARFSHDRISNLFPGPKSNAQNKGVAAHAELLRR